MLGRGGAVFSEPQKNSCNTRTVFDHQSLMHSFIAVAEFIRHCNLSLVFNYTDIYRPHIKIFCMTIYKNISKCAEEFCRSFNSHCGGVESKLVPLGTSANSWPIVPAPGDCEDAEFR
jgi:hypothetical protein